MELRRPPPPPGRPQGGLSCYNSGLGPKHPGRSGLPLPVGFHATSVALSGKHIKGPVSEPDVRGTTLNVFAPRVVVRSEPI